MTQLVVDASIAVKWVVAEDGAADAVRLRSAGRLAAPDLLTAECANILWKKVRRGELSHDEGLIAARLLQRADIELHPMRALLEPSMRLALELDHAAYDCMYLALAIELEAAFVTADLRFAEKVRQSAPLLGQAVRTLSEAATL